jgi:flagellar biosynthesis/type III secretory pathway M-ring protein FliF/YscJ
MEQMARLEQYHRNKIMQVLSYIPGVIVAVNVRTDPVLRQETHTTAYQDKAAVEREYTRESSSKDVTRAAEGGARPNTQLSIASDNGSGRSETTSETETNYRPLSVTSETHSTSLGIGEKQINVTINVPRSYFVSIWKMQQTDGSKEPDETALAPLVKTQLAAIESQVEPLLSAQTQGVVHANMILDRASMANVAQAGTGSGGTVQSLMNNGWAGTIGVGALAVVALAMMMFLVRKATQQTSLPSVEELAGLPPSLPMDEELVGEAEESEGGMAGMELNDEQIRSRKMAEQIGELVKSNPTEAAALFNRWIRKDE